MLFRNGEIAATKVGAMPKSKLYEWVEESLGAVRLRPQQSALDHQT